MILLGIGFTTARLAKRLLARGGRVYGVTREPSRFSALRALGLRLQDFERGALPENSTVIHTIPPLAAEERVKLRRFLEELNPRRVIYISATSVYGAQVEVDETTAAADFLPCSCASLESKRRE